MSILEQPGQRWLAPTGFQCQVRVDPAHTDRFAGPAGAPGIRDGEKYYQLRLATVALQTGAGWSGGSQAAVYAALSFELGGQSRTICHVAGPGVLGEARAAGGAAVILDYALTPLVPFNGGDVRIEAGLVAVAPGGPIAAELDTLATRSHRLIVPEFSSMLADSETIAGELSALLHGAQARTQLQLYQKLGGDGETELCPGYVAAIALEPGALSAEQLWVKEDRLLVGASRASAKPLTGVSYLLLRIDATPERDDVAGLRSIRQPYEEAVALLGEANYAVDARERETRLELAEDRLRTALDAVFEAPELTRVVGRKQMLDALKRGFDEQKSGQALGAVPSAGADSFGSAWRQRMPVEDAAVGTLLTERGAAPEPRPKHKAKPPEPPALDPGSSLPRPGPVAPRGDPVRSLVPRGPVAEIDDEHKVVRRTPHMEVKKKQPLKPGDSFKVRVYADQEPPRAGETTVQLAAVVKRTATRLDVDVWIAATPHFLLGRTRSRSLKIPLTETKPGADDKPAKPPPGVTFDVSVRKKLADPSEPRLWAYFTHEGRPCGQVSIAVAIQGAGSALAPPVDRAGEAPDTSGAPQAKERAEPPAILSIEEAPPPDLTIEITDPTGNRQTLECCVRSPHRGVDAGPIPWSLPLEAGALVAGFMKEFVKKDATPKQRLRSLLGAGYALWNVVPKPLQAAVWKLIDAGKLETILVVSEEPYIPWELMTPSRARKGKLETRAPLGVEFAMGRWIPANHLSPPHRVRITQSLVIAPDYQGAKPKPLKHAQREAEEVLAKFPGRILRPVNFDNVDSTLFAPGYSLVHFVCHGANSPTPGLQAIYLEDGELTSLQVSGMLSSRSELQDRPFVFLNACEVGRPMPALAGIGGFAKSFIDLGASAVVAPLWSVEDEIANQVANEFYAAVTASPALSLGAAFKAIRAKAYAAEGGPDTYAAYCFYGDPTATLQEATR